ncbi:MAG: metallopeptidase family protein [Chloroflexi bacterium]|nr:metallopeptidase family protein [Chloroflexota bacterium]
MVAKAFEELPQEFLDMLDNVDIVVEDYPTPEQIEQAELEHAGELLGLYEGIPQTERTTYYGMVLPDKITLFRKPIEARCRNADEVYAEVRKTLRHEIAHHFGISDARLKELEADE